VERTFILAAGALVIAGGIGLRFLNLGGLEFYHDEAAAMTLMTGHFATDLSEKMRVRGSLTAAEVLQTQRLEPGLGVVDTITQLSLNDPLHPPLHYFLGRIWMGVFGDSIAAIRSLSVFISAICVLALWHLIFALFASRPAAWIGALLAAASPFQFLAATSAREYCLWILMLILTDLQFVKRNSPRLYILFAILSCYTSLLSLFMLLGHAITAEKRGFRLRHLLIMGGGLVLTLPWLWAVRQHWAGFSYMHWMSEPVSSLAYITSFGASIYKIFFDLDLRPTAPPMFWLAAAPPIGLIFIVIAVAFRRLFIERRPQAVMLILWMGTALLPTLGVDLLFGGHRGMSPRYHFHVFLIIEIVVAWYLSRLMSEARTRAYGLTLLLIALGLYSGYSVTQAKTWWHKDYQSEARNLLESVKDSENALIASVDIHHLAAISHYAAPTTELTRSQFMENSPRYRSYSHIYLLREEAQNQKAFMLRTGAQLTEVTPGLLLVSFEPKGE
jgi:uncharacterized membrane protein